ncbi:MAG TPA: hypothetical protein VFX51_01855 [Solirubrobacteraceae bacterium]|nr:hypothetical protein [Solirubrobacteraceae bacterium]
MTVIDFLSNRVPPLHVHDDTDEGFYVLAGEQPARWLTMSSPAGFEHGIEILGPPGALP